LASILVDGAVEDGHVGGRSVEAGFRRHEPSLHMASVLVYGGGVDCADDDRHVESAIDYVGRSPPSIEGKNRTPLLVGIFG
jgi:hypothetical protein